MILCTPGPLCPAPPAACPIWFNPWFRLLGEPIVHTELAAAAQADDSAHEPPRTRPNLQGTTQLFPYPITPCFAEAPAAAPSETVEGADRRRARTIVDKIDWLA
ncbi:hypothetical protein A0H81_14565 [Grifola frondosa]|uniref:Uncharacterized protein n=1 Tax=Grifola frondosa TaxID=5627 RepID=A0A1C7LRI3_GRIFR|nr:hypothetical protein A0H81_14565 [Grifola frondosa]